MKQLLNNLSEEEKNSIRKQHKGGMKVNTERFHSLIESKLGNVKPLLIEQENTPQTTDPEKSQELEIKINDLDNKISDIENQPQNEIKSNENVQTIKSIRDDIKNLKQQIRSERKENFVSKVEKIYSKISNFVEKIKDFVGDVNKKRLLNKKFNLERKLKDLKNSGDVFTFSEALFFGVSTGLIEWLLLCVILL